MKTSKEFPPRPLFEHDMLLDQITYGASRYPFSSASHQPSRIEDFPGFCEFAKQVIPIGWSSQAKRSHVDAIAEATRKVVGYLSSHRAPSEAVAIGAGS